MSDKVKVEKGGIETWNGNRRVGLSKWKDFLGNDIKMDGVAYNLTYIMIIKLPTAMFN